MDTWIVCPHCEGTIDCSNGIQVHQRIEVVMPMPESHLKPSPPDAINAVAWEPTILEKGGDLGLAPLWAWLTADITTGDEHKLLAAFVVAVAVWLAVAMQFGY